MSMGSSKWEGVKGFVGLDIDERGGSNRMNDHNKGIQR